AREVAAPISAIDNLTVLSTEGAGAIPKQVNDNVIQTLNMLKTTTGVDLGAMLRKAADSTSANGTVEIPAGQ
ncbi:MAG TPA: flotillin family protein, partial [Nocardioides sp.]